MYLEIENFHRMQREFQSVVLASLATMKIMGDTEEPYTTAESKLHSHWIDMEASFPYRNFTKEHRGLLTSFWTCEFSEETTNTKKHCDNMLQVQKKVLILED